MYMAVKETHKQHDGLPGRLRILIRTGIAGDVLIIIK